MTNGLNTVVLSPNGGPLSVPSLSNFLGASYSVMSFYTPSNLTLTYIKLHRSVSTSINMSIAIYNASNVRIYTGTLSSYTATTFIFPIDNVFLIGGQYYYFAVFSTALNMYAETVIGSAIVNSGLHSSIQFSKVSFVGTSLPTSLPTSGGSGASFIYPPFQLIGYK